MDFFDHLNKEFANSKNAFLYSIKRLPESKIVVINVGLSSLTYNSGFFNIRSLRNFIADVSELINSDSRKRVVIVVSDPIRNTQRQYLDLQERRKNKKNDIEFNDSGPFFETINLSREKIAPDSRNYSALVAMIHSDIANLFYDGFSDYNLRAIGFSVSPSGTDAIGGLKRVIKSIESIAFKSSLSEKSRINAIKEVLQSTKNLTQSNGYKSVTQKTAETIKGIFKLYPRTIPIIMEDVSNENNLLEEDDGFAAKIAIAINADVVVSISKKGMLYTVDPIKSEKALPFYCYDTSRTTPFSTSRKSDLSKKLNAAKSVNSHSRPIPMLLSPYNAPYTICNMFDPIKIDNICSNGDFPRFTIFINTNKILRFSMDVSLPIEERHVAGIIFVDANAADALLNKSSLLSVGITGIEGSFERKTTVAIMDENAIEIGRGVTAFSSLELQQTIDSHNSVTVINRTRMRINSNYRRGEK